MKVGQSAGRWRWSNVRPRNPRQWVVFACWLGIAFLLIQSFDWSSEDYLAGSSSRRSNGSKLKKQTLFLRPHDANEKNEIPRVPGPIQNSTIYLLGGRLNPSLDYTSLEITLFALPGGDFVKPPDKAWRGVEHGLTKKTCVPINSTKNSVLDTLWTTQQIQTEYRWYITLKCRSFVFFSNVCHSSVELKMVPYKVLDGNLARTTMILKANLTDHFDTTTILSRIRSSLHGLGRTAQSLEVALWFRPFSETWNDVSVETTESLPSAVMNLPLYSSLSIGYGGPPLHYGKFGRMDALLCVPIHNAHTAKHVIAEFVQHHLNVGFDQIVFGILDAQSLEDVSVQIIQSVLHPFERVLLQPAGLPDQDNLQCETDLLKSFFLNSCLYHAKAHADYVGVWDLDEYWTPPMWSDVEQWIERPKSVDRATWRTADPQWLKSSYATYPSVSQAMQAIQAYQDEHGCGNHWCFHSFGSSMVHPKNGRLPRLSVNHSLMLSDMFSIRDIERRPVWHKSIGVAARADVVALHEFGSCPAPEGDWLDTNTGAYNRARTVLYTGQTDKCKSLLTFPKENTLEDNKTIQFGQIHHFYVLLGQAAWRTHHPLPAWNKSLSDEYLTTFSPTVQVQLAEMYK